MGATLHGRQVWDAEAGSLVVKQYSEATAAYFFPILATV